MEMEASEIDALLERYLHLLHEYTTLRTELGSVQTGIYQNLARANFSAERGIRYGEDFYDDRMQACRRLKIADLGGSLASFQVARYDLTEENLMENLDASQEDKDGISGNESDAKPTDLGVKKAKPRKEDPLRWFGLLTPLPLRQAQGQSIKAVENIIPRLASISVEMEHLEIEVRRARKKRAKAEAQAKRDRIGVSRQEIVA